METVPSRTQSPADIATLRADRLWDAPSPLRIWHLASMDAPTVAVVWSLGFAWAGGLQLPSWAPILLALAAWAVYIGDRLLDAHAGMQSPPRHELRDRHTFHWHHRRTLGFVGIAAAGASLWIIVTRLPAGARTPDSVVAAATLVYFSGVHGRFKLPGSLERLLSPFCTKAFLIGTLFTAGCLLPVWSQLRLANTIHLRGGWLIAPALFFAVLGWLNCHAIGRWESARHDRPMGRLQRIAGIVAISGLVIAVSLAFVESRSAILIALGSASALLLGLLDRLKARLTPLALRAAADLVLLTPILLIPFEHAPR